MNDVNDAISRQQAIDALKEHRALYCDDTPDAFSKLSYAEKSRVDELDTAIATLINLPSVESKRIKKKWVGADTQCGIACSVCGVAVDDFCHSADYIDLDYEPNFCPNCGVKMEVTT